MEVGELAYGKLCIRCLFALLCLDWLIALATAVRQNPLLGKFAVFLDAADPLASLYRFEKN